MPYQLLVCKDCDYVVDTCGPHGPEDEYCEGDGGFERIDVFTEQEMVRRREAVIADDEAMSRARHAYVAGPPHGIKHSDMDRLEHMRNAIRAAFGISLPSRETRLKDQCLFPRADGGRCCECANCQPCSRETNAPKET